MKILVTGGAGFIGFSLTRRLLEQGHEVVGMDNINTYYDTGLKYARLAELGIERAGIVDAGLAASHTYPAYRFTKLDLADRAGMERLFAAEGFDHVVNLGGQAGVRYSIDNPYAYAEANLMGFLNVLECCRHYPVKHLVYASSSSVYGMMDHVPYREMDRTDSPVSLYAATKKSNELMAYAYAKLYRVPATGVRFFTVYGPWGRPDMAPFKFLKAVLEGQPIRVFNRGDLQRDFTYIDDIVQGTLLILGHPATGDVPHTIYNIGHGEPVRQSLDALDSICENHGYAPTNVLSYPTAAFAGLIQNDRILLEVPESVNQLMDIENLWQFFIISLEDYNRLMGASETLAEDEVMVYVTKDQTYDAPTLTIGTGEPLQEHRQPCVLCSFDQLSETRRKFVVNFPVMRS